ncbi:hypothetical protein HPB47_008036 [Ixodes persulcatus]|uniref:Uncharacterized protein n=1 Tax=Ixodes persulcatus TaxID=34615 RepID=A0AC60P5W4_IXOPE|nr:hypothetical protein HPB47_008036 [Ixodes persulcatus]
MLQDLRGCRIRVEFAAGRRTEQDHPLRDERLCAVQSTGNEQTALDDIFAILNISHRGLHNKTYQRYVKEKLNPATKRAACTISSKCATTVSLLYKELSYGSMKNIAVSYNGSWKTRGHCSHIGVGTVIELFTGLVLDQVVLSNFCVACKKGPKEGNVGYSDWKSSHEATGNKACQMEVEAALILFARSWERHGLRYATMLSDGDSRSFTALQEANVYGFFPVEKEDYVNHAQKRMGTALRSLVQKQKGQKGAAGTSLGGKERLTAELITRLSSYYGWALKSHEGDVDAMHNALGTRVVMVAMAHTLSPPPLSRPLDDGLRWRREDDEERRRPSSLSSPRSRCCGDMVSASSRLTPGGSSGRSSANGVPGGLSGTELRRRATKGAAEGREAERIVKLHAPKRKTRDVTKDARLDCARWTRKTNEASTAACVGRAHPCERLHLALRCKAVKLNTHALVRGGMEACGRHDVSNLIMRTRPWFCLITVTAILRFGNVSSQLLAPRIADIV